MTQQIALERQALEQLRRGDLRGARGTLGLLLELRPNDVKVSRRLAQVADLIDKRDSARARIAAEPLRYAHSYIKAGRLEEGLKLLRAALAQDPNNARLRELALQVARRLKHQNETAPTSSRIRAEREAAEAQLRASTTNLAPVKRPRSRTDLAPPPRFPPRKEERAEVASAEPVTAPAAPLPPLEPQSPTRTLEALLVRVRSRRRQPSRWILAS